MQETIYYVQGNNASISNIDYMKSFSENWIKKTVKINQTSIKQKKE